MSARPPCLALFKGCRKEWGGEAPWAQKKHAVAAYRFDCRLHLDLTGKKL